MVTSQNKGNPSDEKLDNILDAIKALTDQVKVLDRRISLLEGSFEQSTIPFTLPELSKAEPVPQVDFDDRDEMLKRAYIVLTKAHRPMTTQEVAEQIGRSRSTTSQYLNELHQRNLLLKTQGTTPDKSRNIVFSPVSITQEKSSK